MIRSFVIFIKEWNVSLCETRDAKNNAATKEKSQKSINQFANIPLSNQIHFCFTLVAPNINTKYARLSDSIDPKNQLIFGQNM